MIIIIIIIIIIINAIHILSENTSAKYLEITRRNYRKQPFWHHAHNSESTNVKVQNFYHGK